MEKKKDTKVHFTSREKDIMSLLLFGLTNREIADKLIVTTHTVRVILEHIYEKTSCHTRVQLVVYILKNKIMEIPDTDNILQ